jgi:hypothetical protein
VISRRPSPTFLLVLGLTCLAIGGALLAVHRTITDEPTILRESGALARSEPVREEFAGRIAAAMTPPSIAPDPAALHQTNETARAAVQTPQFEEAFQLALPTIYARMVNGVDTPVTLDPALIAAAIRSTGVLPPANLHVDIDADSIPDLRRPLDLAARAATALGVLGLVLVVAGLVLSPHRGRAVMRIGRWLITVGVLAILLFWAIPTLALLPLGGWVGVAGILLATGEWIVVPAAVVAAVGVTILVFGRLDEDGDRRRELSVIPKVPTRRTAPPPF